MISVEQLIEELKRMRNSSHQSILKFEKEGNIQGQAVHIKIITDIDFTITYINMAIENIKRNKM